MTFNGWAVMLNGVVLSTDCNATQEDFNEICPSNIPVDEDGQLALVIDGLDLVPTGLGVPPVRTEDLTYAQRDGVKHFNDWYEPRVLEFRATVCPDDCPSCGGAGATGMTARQKAALITEAWSRQCCDVELVLFTDCNGVLDPDTKYATEEGTTERTNFALNPAAVSDGSDAEWIARYPLKGTYSYETIDGPLGVEVDSWKKKTFTDTQTATDDGLDHYQSVDAAPPLGLVETLDWAEAWASTAAWTGSGWVAAAGEVESNEPGATIYRNTSDTIGKVVLTDTFSTTVELRDEDGNLLASVVLPPDPAVAVAADTTVVGAGGDTQTASGNGAGTTTLQLDYVLNTLEVSGTTPAPWSAIVTFLGTPTRVQLVAAEGATPNGDFTVGVGQLGDSIAVGPSGNVYVLDISAEEVLKFDLDGTLLTSWNVPYLGSETQGVPVAISVDSTDDVYVLYVAGFAPPLFATDGEVQRYSSAGVFEFGFDFNLDAVGNSLPGIDVASTGVIYITEAGSIKRVRRFTAGGASSGTIHLVATPAGLAVNYADKLFVAEIDRIATFVASTGVISYGKAADEATDIATDASGNWYAAVSGAILKYTSLGDLVWSIETPLDIQSLDVSDSGDYIYGVSSDNTVYRWVQVPGHADNLSAYAIQSAPIARTLEPATQYTISAYGYAESATSALFRIVARLQDGAGNWLAAESAGATVETNGAWARASVTFITPALPGSGVIYLAARSEWVKNDWQVGDVLGGSALMIEVGAAPTDYFDGDFLPVDEEDGQIQYSWVGLENASESIETFHEWAYLTNPTVNGPYGVVGRPARGGVPVEWDANSKCATIFMRFEAINQNLYVLDDCGTPGYEQCVDLTPGAAEYVFCAPFCGPWCANTPVEGTGGLAESVVVVGTQRVYPTITLWPDLLVGEDGNPITIENVTTGDFITYGASVLGEPVVINTEDGTAFQGDVNVTYLLGGNLTTFSVLPGAYEFRALLPGQQDVEGLVTICWRPSVISA